MGLIVPVMSLVFLTRGANIGNLSLFISVAAVTIVAAEVPSGIIADLIGRKKIFVLAHVFRLTSYLLLILWNSPITLCLSMFFRGIGAAFSSGSFEALLVEQHVAEHGEESMTGINSVLFRLDCVGCGLAAILGGILGNVGENYTVLLFVILSLESILILLSCIFIKEDWKRGKGSNPFTDMKNQMTMVGNGIKNSKIVLVIMLMSAIMGCLVSIVEVYWQQSVFTFLQDGMKWILGFISCIAYVGAVIGSKMNKSPKLYWIFRISLPISIFAIGLCQNIFAFVLIYGVTYMIIGAGDLSERIILHQNTQNECRASMLSVYSLFIRVGGVISSVLTSFVVRYFGVEYVWLFIPSAALFLMLIVKMTQRVQISDI